MATQEDLKLSLKHLFGENNVISEWDVAKQSQDALTRRLYCPRIDIVVGPFNTDRNLDANNKLIQQAYVMYHRLIESIHAISDAPNRALLPNDNPRCFITIEIENKTGSKHRIGSIVNASAIGKIGIIATNNRQDFSRIVRIKDYLGFLLTVGKTSYNPQNIMIVLADELLDVINRHELGLRRA